MINEMMRVCLSKQIRNKRSFSVYANAECPLKGVHNWNDKLKQVLPLYLQMEVLSLDFPRPVTSLALLHSASRLL